MVLPLSINFECALSSAEAADVPYPVGIILFFLPPSGCGTSAAVSNEILPVNILTFRCPAFGINNQLVPEQI